MLGRPGLELGRACVFPMQDPKTELTHWKFYGAAWRAMFGEVSEKNVGCVPPRVDPHAY